MPRYYFDLRYDGDPWSNDPDGIDLPSLDEAAPKPWPSWQGS